MSTAPPHRPAAPTSPEERALVARLRAGDRAAFSQLVARHGGALLRLALGFVRERAVAEEVVQDTWVAALDGLDGFEERASLRTWLFRILANKARTRAVREGRSLPFSALAAPDGADQAALDADRFDGSGAWSEPPAAWSEENPERLALGAETRAILEAAIAALPQAQRAVLTLRDVEELETDEICGLLGISVSNQRVLLHRARARLRQALAGHLAGR